METKLFQTYDNDHITDPILQEAAQLFSKLATTTASGAMKPQSSLVPLRSKVGELRLFARHSLDNV